jgi:hypothetical protein
LSFYFYCPKKLLLGPVFAFNSALRTVGISPLDNFMISIHAWSKALNGDLAFGINGKVCRKKLKKIKKFKLKKKEKKKVILTISRC